MRIWTLSPFVITYMWKPKLQLFNLQNESFPIVPNAREMGQSAEVYNSFY